MSFHWFKSVISLVLIWSLNRIASPFCLLYVILYSFSMTPPSLFHACRLPLQHPSVVSSPRCKIIGSISGCTPFLFGMAGVAVRPQIPPLPTGRAQLPQVTRHRKHVRWLKGERPKSFESNLTMNRTTFTKAMLSWWSNQNVKRFEHL